MSARLIPDHDLDPDHAPFLKLSRSQDQEQDHEHEQEGK
jgi:hypothetical protein